MSIDHSPLDTASGSDPHRDGRGDSPSGDRGDGRGAAVPDAGAGMSDGVFRAVQADMVLTGRATLSAEYLRGLIVAGQLAAAGTPRKLPQEVFPDEDPVVVQEVFDRGVAVGFHMARFARNPYLYRDQLARYRRELGEAAYAAMAGALGPVLATAVRAHPADGESEGRGHEEG